MKEMKSLSRELRKAADILDHIGTWMVRGLVATPREIKPRTSRAVPQVETPAASPEATTRLHWTKRPENASKVAAWKKKQSKARSK